MAIAAGGPPSMVAALEAYVAREPLRERPRRALIEAYVASGRRADVLRVYDTYRRHLADELGVSPSVELRRRHDELLVDGDVDRRGIVPPTRSVAAATQGAASADLVVRRSGRAAGGDARQPRDVAADDARRPRGRRQDAAGARGRPPPDGAAAATATPSIFCDLTTATPDSVVDVVIAAAGVEGRVGQTDLDRLAEVLRFQPGLVVLDNCEHVIDVAAIVVERLIETTEQIVVLATSRERLAVDGERLLTVAPLAHAVDADGAISPATQLLVDRVSAVTGRAPPPTSRALLDELAHRLDGLPLALELAAARLQSLTIREVIDGLDEASPCCAAAGARYSGTGRSMPRFVGPTSCSTSRSASRLSAAAIVRRSVPRRRRRRRAGRRSADGGGSHGSARRALDGPS